MPSAKRQVDSRTQQSGPAELSPSVNPLSPRLERIARQIAQGLEAALGDLAERWYQRMAALPELASWDRPEVREAGLENAQTDIGREVAGLLEGRRLPAACPQEVIRSARLAASFEFPLWACIQAYRTGHAVQWEAWSDAVEARALNRADRRALLQAGSQYMFAYADRCSRWVEVEYTRERDRRLRSDEQKRIQLVRNLLDGNSADPSQLGYELDRWHIGMIVSGPSAERELEKLAERFNAPLLAIAASRFTWWGWLGLTEASSSAASRTVRDISLAPGSALAIGEPSFGATGFRQTHEEAKKAAVIAGELGRAVARYDEIALEDLTGSNPDRARIFVTRELGPLTSNDRQARVLRDTLRAYFAASQRASSAAQLLGVHERTVGNRLRAVENLIGRQVVSRRAELEIALRLHPLLDPHD